MVGMKSRIGHMDADCFYVSCERARHPFLRGQPVGVLGNQGACVIAKSYELKARGVTTAMAIWDAVRICPEAIFVKRDFEWYEVLSRRMLDAVRRFSPAVEFYSIDEAFFDAGGLELRDAEELQRYVLREVGVPVSVGLSATKTLAKLASSSVKPFGCKVAFDGEAIAELLRDRPVEKITGVARRSAKRLADHGVRTCTDFVNADRRLIRRLLTKRGEDLWWELNGTIALPLAVSRVAHKNLSRGGSLGQATSDSARLEGWTARNTERLIEALDYHQVFSEQLAMDLAFKDGGGLAWRVRLPCATADFATLYAAGLQLLRVCAPPGVAVSYMHLIAEGLTSRDCVQLSLFEQEDRRAKAVAAVKRQVNEQVGRFMLRSGATLPVDDIYADRTNAYDICDVYGKTCF